MWSVQASADDVAGRAQRRRTGVRGGVHICAKSEDETEIKILI